jgi:2-succinyl-5-enolpyruvyl-6-hydroxy-3-cyclohexene-1-carboxylate synthase
VKPSDLQTEWARLLVCALARSGVTELVLSPGSRSTPFLLAFLEHGGFRIHDFIDERVAAFFALGQARASGLPSVLLCTSGSAPAHYYPAIVEANVAHVPMIVLSADRPVALLGCGESQTIDQQKLFGDHVRHFVDLGLPSGSASAMHALRRHVAQTVAKALGPTPGPVHLDARATRPLEPSAAQTPEALTIARRAAEIRAVVPTRIDASRVLASEAGIDAVARRIDAASRVLIVAGPAPISAAETRAVVSRFASVLHAPVLAEATSQLRFGLPGGVVGSFDALFRSPEVRTKLAPALVIQIEGAPIAKGLSLLDEHADIERIVIASHGHPDPTSRASHVIIGDVANALARLCDAVEVTDARAAYRDAVLDADTVASRIVTATLDATGDTLTEAVTVDAVVAASRGATLFVGNSLPVREIDTWALPMTRGPRVLSQRGASGIDGNLAGAAGSASKLGATVALVGDVTFLHDLGGLAAVAKCTCTMVVVVINNGGGRIFEQLPIGGHVEALPYFSTPHHADLGAAARVFGVRHTVVSSRTALVDALVEALAFERASVIEAVVPPSDAVVHHRALWSSVAAALAEPRP